MHYSESELISEIKKRNPDAFDYLIKEYSKPVYYLTYNILNIGNSKEDIEECVSDVFVEAWQKIDRYNEQKSTLRSWILMLTKYRALNYKRFLEKHPLVYLEDYAQSHHEPADTQSLLLDRETQLLLLQTLNTFGEFDRQLFIRRYFFNESIAELMHSLGLSRSAVDNRLLRSRNKIKEALFCG